MNRARLQYGAVAFTAVLLAVSAVGYFVAPAAMLSVVGIADSPEHAFLARAVGAALVAMVPMAWGARRRSAARTERWALVGLAIYMLLGSAVDLHAYLTGLVGLAAIPSLVIRTGLAALFALLAV